MPDLLPSWLILVGITAVGSALSSLLSGASASRVYDLAAARPRRDVAAAANAVNSNEDSSPPKRVLDGPAVDPLAGRLFAVWNGLSAVVRLYAALNIHNGPVYDLAIVTFALAALHFNSEVYLFGTASPRGAALLMTEIVSISSLVWMGCQRSYYVL